MTDPAWESFFRTGLPQAYTFAKARMKDGVRTKKHGKGEKKEMR